MSSTPKLHSGLAPTLGYGAYLGTSWTWVIGMLFPALILRDYGLWGFVAFALPNVLGAAAMGFVLTPARARNILENHKTACAWFSVVTMAFHLFVAAWLLPALLGPWSLGILLVTVVACLLAHRFAGIKGIWLASAAVWLLSMAMFYYGSKLPDAWSGAHWEMGRLGTKGLLAFIPASVLGFTLCPYLDLTFLKARAETEKNTGRGAFAFGFGVVFCAMIFFTVCYGGQLIEHFDWNFPLDHQNDWNWFTSWSWILMAHLPVQIGLTLAWHGKEVSSSALIAFKRLPVQRSKDFFHFPSKPQLLQISAQALFVFVLFSGFFCSFHLSRLVTTSIDEIALSYGESFYRSFLLLYGTILPAYVLLKIIPTRHAVSEKFRTLIFVGAALISYPLAWGAFVLFHHWLILPCAGVLTFAFLLVQFGPKQKSPLPSRSDA